MKRRRLLPLSPPLAWMLIGSTANWQPYGAKTRVTSTNSESTAIFRGMSF